MNQKQFLEGENTVTRMKNLTDIFGSRLNTAKQKLSKLEMGMNNYPNYSTQRRKNSNHT